MKNKATPSIRTKMSPLMRVVKFFYKLFSRKYVVECAEPLPDKCIVLGTHIGVKGPLVYTSYMPRYIAPWGDYRPMGNYRMRWNYLYYIFYRQKLHLGKFTAFIKATLLALVNKLAYSGVGLISTYPDSRQLGTIKRSIQHLEGGVPILIFPENSNDGYDEVVSECHSGFVVLARSYYSKHGEDLPIYPSRICTKSRKIYVGKPMYAVSMLSTLSRDEVAEQFKHAINNAGK